MARGFWDMYPVYSLIRLLKAFFEENRKMRSGTFRKVGFSLATTISPATSIYDRVATRLGGSIAKVALGLLIGFVSINQDASAQERHPEDTGLWDYHSAPNYRESESHPLRIVGYVLHPIGWVAQELLFRPLSYFASSSETTRKVMGYRDPFDFRKPTCFSADDSTPNCRDFAPYNYNARGTVGAEESVAEIPEPARQVYFPDVNFNFNSHKLTDLGEGRVRQIAELLNKEPGIKIVLEGHADYIGTDTYNEKLGMNRAEAVRQRLVALGVSSERLASVTFGKSKPVLAEQENWARAVNRRVSVQPGGEPSAPQG
jgi:outer membrane protein OmpA-like peptidoglycan-associated protein